MAAKLIFGAVALAGAGMLILGSTRACGPDPDEKKLFCPVVGLPECRTCECKTGYCSTKPKVKHMVALKGATLVFCCGTCKETFEKSPEKFTANANHQLVASGQARQEKCPLCGGKVDKSQSITLGGLSVELCSKSCRDKVVAAKPAEQLGAIFGAEGFARGFVMTAKK